jgi:hypothetical protein
MGSFFQNENESTAARCQFVFSTRPTQKAFDFIGVHRRESAAQKAVQSRKRNRTPSATIPQPNGFVFPTRLNRSSIKSTNTNQEQNKFALFLTAST